MTMIQSVARDHVKQAARGHHPSLGALLQAMVDGDFVPTRHVRITDAATYTVLAQDSGVPHIIPELAASITITLPTPKDGLSFEFFGKGVAVEAQGWIFTTGSDTNFFNGSITHADTDAGAGADELVPVYPDGNSNSKLTLATPHANSRVRFISDGTLWTVEGIGFSVTAPAFADQ